MKFTRILFSKQVAQVLMGMTLVVLPVVVSAQVTSPVASGSYCKDYTGGLNLTAGKTVTDILKFGTCFIQRSIIPLLFTLAVLFFVYGVVDFIRASATGDKLDDKKQFMMWGIIALAVMTGVWGLVAIVTNTFGISNVIPQLPVNGQ